MRYERPCVGRPGVSVGSMPDHNWMFCELNRRKHSIGVSQGHLPGAYSRFLTQADVLAMSSVGTKEYEIPLERRVEETCLGDSPSRFL